MYLIQQCFVPTSATENNHNKLGLAFLFLHRMSYLWKLVEAYPVVCDSRLLRYFSGGGQADKDADSNPHCQSTSPFGSPLSVATFVPGIDAYCYFHNNECKG